MVYLAIWLFVVLAGLTTVWARRQLRLNSELKRKLAENEARTEKLAAYVQRAMEDTYVLSIVMTERGHIEPEAIEKGRARLLKKAPPAEKTDVPPQVEAQVHNRTVH